MATHNKFDDIIPPSRRRESEPLSKSNARERASFRESERSSRFPFTTVGVVLVIVAASAGALFYFSSAKVEIVPNTVSATVQASFTGGQGASDVPFKIITAQKIASQSVRSSGTKTVSTSASGTITIYNTQSKPQKLIANTRFATASGLIFRIHTAVSVPAGTTAKPGTATATVFADKVGSSYNVGPSSFTVPGFAGTPQASAVYARSTAAMTGGASGTVPVVDPIAEGPARRALTDALGPDLSASIQGQVPAGYVLLPGAMAITYQELTSTPSATSGMVDVKEQGTATAVVFPNAALAKAVASSIPGINYQGGELTFVGTDKLVFAAASMPEQGATTVSFTLSGTAPLVYSIDKSRIATAVAGKTRAAAEVALTNYPEVSRAIIVLRPFWKQTFPEDPASISIVVTNP